MLLNDNIQEWSNCSSWFILGNFAIYIYWYLHCNFERNCTFLVTKCLMTLRKIVLHVHYMQKNLTPNNLHPHPPNTQGTSWHKAIHFKSMLLCFKSLNNNDPAYRKELVTPYRPTQSLRTGSCNLLVEPTSKMKTYGDRAFSIAGPKLWKSLPNTVKDSNTINGCKKSLKTHLFKIAFRK